MKNKGFTLIELLITIALIAVLSISAGIGITEMLHRQNNNKIDEYKKTIENAACAFAELYPNELTGSTIRKVTIRKILSKGLLIKDIVNPTTQKKLEEDNDELNHEVTIIIEYGEKKCVY